MMDLTGITAPLVPAADRTLPVPEPLRTLLPEGGLVRGRIVSCQGPAGPSTAFALVAEAVQAGAWLAVVDLPWLGVEALDELGITLDRLVRIDTGRPAPQRWAELLGATLDGFEVIVTQVPDHVGAGVVRRIQARVQARRAVLVIVGESPVPTDVVLHTSMPVWDRAGHGHGHLRARRLCIEAAGRRIPRARRAELWLPGPAGGVTLAEPSVEPSTGPSTEPLLPLRSAG